MGVDHGIITWSIDHVGHVDHETRGIRSTMVDKILTPDYDQDLRLKHKFTSARRAGPIPRAFLAWQNTKCTQLACKNLSTSVDRIPRVSWSTCTPWSTPVYEKKKNVLQLMNCKFFPVCGNVQYIPKDTQHVCFEKREKTACPIACALSITLLVAQQSTSRLPR